MLLSFNCMPRNRKLALSHGGLDGFSHLNPFVDIRRFQMSYFALHRFTYIYIRQVRISKGDQGRQFTK